VPPIYFFPASILCLFYSPAIRLFFYPASRSSDRALATVVSSTGSGRLFPLARVGSVVGAQPSVALPLTNASTFRLHLVKNGLLID
jgi:hypothetical protein